MVTFLEQLAIAVVTFSGLFLGTWVLFIAPEELKPGRGWFRLVAAIVLGFSVYVSFSQMRFRIPLSALAAVCIIMLNDEFFREELMRTAFKAGMGLVAGVLFFFTDNLMMTASLLFLFFIAFASMMFYPDEKDVKKGHVKHKIRYVKEILLPCSTFFAGVAFEIIMMVI